MSILSVLINEISTAFNKQSVNKLFYFLLSTLIICAPALYNGYPLLFSDTGAYIHSAFTLKPPSSRPIGYGLFIMIFSARLTLWTVMYAQCLIINRLIWDVLKLTLPGRNLYPYHFTTIIILMLVSSMSWYSCQIMPDIFITGIFMILFIFLVDEQIKPLRWFILSLLLFAFIISHFSHIAITLAILITVLAIFFFNKNLFIIRKIFFRRITWLLAILIISVVFIMSNHYCHERGFKLSPTSKVFLAARLCETGILQKYLEENCHEIDNVLCDQKETIPSSVNDFLWTNKSPVKVAGFKNWFEADSAFAPVIDDIMRTPKYLYWFAWESIKATSRQLFTVDIGSGLIGYRESSPVYPPVKKYLGNEAVEMLVTQQSWGKLDFTFINYVNYAVLGLSLIIIFWRIFRKKVNKQMFAFIIITGIGILYNTTITSILSNISHRKQARVTWILVFIAMIFIFAVFKEFRERYLPEKTEAKNK